MCAALHRAEMFGNALAQSPSLWYDPAVDYFVVCRSTRELAVPTNWAAGEVASRPRHFRDAPRAQGYFVDCQEYVSSTSIGTGAERSPAGCRRSTGVRSGK